jgi:hypothetical protein
VVRVITGVAVPPPLTTGADVVWVVTGGGVVTVVAVDVTVEVALVVAVEEVEVCRHGLALDVLELEDAVVVVLVVVVVPPGVLKVES